MKYLVIEETSTDWFVDEYDNKEDAIKEADAEWSKKTDSDKERAARFYVLESANPDPDADDHLDGDYVKIYKE